MLETIVGCVLLVVVLSLGAGWIADTLDDSGDFGSYSYGRRGDRRDRAS